MNIHIIDLKLLKRNHNYLYFRRVISIIVIHQHIYKLHSQYFYMIFSLAERFSLRDNIEGEV